MKQSQAHCNQIQSKAIPLCLEAGAVQGNSNSYLQLWLGFKLFSLDWELNYQEALLKGKKWN